MAAHRHARPRLRPLLPAVLLALALLAPGAGFGAQGMGNMAQDMLDSFTTSPAAQQKAAKTAGSSGPRAPAQPVAPTVGPAAGAAPAAVPHPAFRQGPAPAQAGGVRQESLSLQLDGAERRAVLILPKSPALKKGQAAPRLPLLIFLHGAGGSASQAMRQTNLAGRAAAAGFLTVFPEGLGPAEGQTWNAWMCCGYARDQRVDDIGFLSALIDRLQRDHHADPRRIYLAGFSNGAMLASRFALERPGVAAALAVVGGYLPCDPDPLRSQLPILVIHGARDAMARFGPTRAHPVTGRFCEDYPARAQVDHFARGMGLSPKPHLRDSQTSPVRIEDYSPKQKGAKGFLRFLIVKNGGHAWPGGVRERYRYCDPPTAGPDATGLLLDFFQHPPVAVDTAAAPAKPVKNRKTQR